MFTSKEELNELRKVDKCLSIHLWHEETLAKLQARLLNLRKEWNYGQAN